MNKLVSVGILIFLLSGCATLAPFDYHEHCALEGMKLAGVTESSVAMMTGFGRYATVGAGTGTTVNCAEPETLHDQCEIGRWRKVAEPKVEYNKTVGTKQTINGLADLLIVPGIVAHVIYAGQKSDAIDESIKLNQTLDSCEDAGRMPGSTSPSSP